IGTALSIALYIVGFAESFLAIDAIRDFCHLGKSPDDIRIVGTVVILLLVIIAFISTSLALKVQYFVLAAIALSLVSIFGGLFTKTSFSPDTSIMLPFADGVSLEVVFAIFFPAVTGFTAGVAMSGDLKNPNKSIPRGTMYSIIVGLIIYIVLAIALAVFVKRDILINDTDFLLKVALYAPLVVAGIWGATLSSALGGILGAPRILQAISKDRLIPKIFGKGHGVSDEPKNALVLSFIIAEGGILMGDLNAIASVVTMFYLAAYGFINLAYVLEKWASSDFRPTFTVPKWIGVAGFVASFAVMFKLDTIAMIVALLIMFLIYITLKRKELKFDFGDVWQSVWSTLVRDSLHKMDVNKLEDRNWRPNIILFSGHKKVRHHLIDFGKMLVGQHGFLSDFELIENRDKTSILPKWQKVVQTNDNKKDAITGVFTRRESCNDIYDGIVSISRYYGFSGVEPNTVMLGWGRHTDNPIKFVEMVQNLTRLDLNILMMDYDARVGFGKYKTIDIWWRGSNNNGNFSLAIVRFLWLSEEFRDANVRLLIINHDNDKKIQIEQRANDILSTMRLRAELKVINNEIEKRSFYDIIEAESLNTDLTFLGIPDVEIGSELEYVSKINALCKDIGTVVLVKASSNFKEIDLGVDSAAIKLENKIKPVIGNDSGKTTLVKIENSTLSYAVKQFSTQLKEVTDEITDVHLMKLFNYQDELLHSYFNIIEEVFLKLKDETSPIQNFNIHNNDCNSDFHPTNKKQSLTDEIVEEKGLTKEYHVILYRIKKLLLHHQNEIGTIQKHKLEEIRGLLIKKVYNVIAGQAEKIEISVPYKKYEFDADDSFGIKIYKTKQKLISGVSKQPVKYNVHFRKLLYNHSQQKKWGVVTELFEQWGIVNIQFFVEFGKLVDKVAKGFIKIENGIDITAEDISAEYEMFKVDFAKLHELNIESYNNLSQYVKEEYVGFENSLSTNLNKLRINLFIPKISYKNVNIKTQQTALIPEKWYQNQNLILNNLYLKVVLFEFSDNLKRIFYDTVSDMQNIIKRDFLDIVADFDSVLNEKELKTEKIKEYIAENDFTIGQIKVKLKDSLESFFRRVRNASSSFPEHIILMSEEAFNNYYTQQFGDAETKDVFVSRLINYISQKEIINPLQEYITDTTSELEKNSKRIRDLIKQITFGISDEKSESDLKNSVDSNVNIDIEKKSLSEELKKISIQIALMENFFRDRISVLESVLTLTSFTKNIQNLTQYVKEQESKERRYKMREYLTKADKILRTQISQIWYRGSKGILLARRLKNQGKNRETRVEDLLSIRNSLFVSKNMLAKVPFYYQQLFIRKQYYLDEFWVGRSRELSQAKKAFDNYDNGFKGALLVLGERNSGRSFFAQYTAKKYAPKVNIYTVYTPYSGSLSVNRFKAQLQRVLDKTGSYDEMFLNLETGSVVIFDDIELWWEKSKHGDVVIREIA
ncbi:MAG: hypothetical protein U9R32_02790, partial [Bacteroidota bacterium]|nr:hypothetical protein [Bacteroidota bacterium]